MPNNILITPGSASIQFSGSSANTIQLLVEPSGGVTFYGNSGSLLGITDNLSGSLMSVNDVSGFPILEVFSDDRVVMGTLNKNTLVVTGSSVAIGKNNPTATFDVSGSTSITGSLQVTEQLIGTASVATSASFAATSSYALNTGGAGFPFSGSAVITGSLQVITDGITGSLFGTATTASYTSQLIRTIASASTTTLTNNATDNITIPTAKIYSLLKIATSNAAWVRVYTDSGSRTSDASRSQLEDPIAGSGVIAEVITTGNTTQPLTPAVMGENFDNPATSNSYLAVTNLSGTPAAITVTLTYLPLEV